MKHAVLAITYNGKQYPQGKYFEKEGKRYFVVNIDEKKLFRTFNGYGISKEVLDAFSRHKLRNILIVYRVVGKNMTYVANPTLFKSKGILVAYGGHPQYVLPIKNWKVYPKDFTIDPKDLPVLPLSKWGEQPQYRYEGNVAIPI